MLTGVVAKSHSAEEWFFTNAYPNRLTRVLAQVRLTDLRWMCINSLCLFCFTECSNWKVNETLCLDERYNGCWVSTFRLLYQVYPSKTFIYIEVYVIPHASLAVRKS